MIANDANAILSQRGATSTGHIAIIACHPHTIHNITIDKSTYLSYRLKKNFQLFSKLK
jgi:hypothetical protein